MVLLTEQIIKGKTRLDKLEEVKNLNLWGQDLDDCAILAKLPNLEVLSLSVNRLSSLKDFRHCTKLQELYLRKNDIRDLNELQYLVHLKDLRVLWLSDNPCAEQPGYKQIVVRMLPNLQKLDNKDVADIVASADASATPSADASPPAAARTASGSAATPSPQGTPQRQPGRQGSATASPDHGGSGGGGHGQRANGGSAEAGAAAGGAGGGSGGAGGGGGRSTKNILYAVMALLGELEEEDLVYVKREIDQLIRDRC